ncbi:hypothetical protein [Microbacterium indicum]|uniref:hypothetical protein n=1 Tax=Microbacterium indicum TaxID=358100 RepID=UPI000425EAA0|nr:hypothetical protein [Microbacterium indicum]
MGAALHLAALLPASVGVCCLAAAPGARARAAEVIASIVMVAAMTDVALGGGVVPAVLWAIALVICSLALAVGARLARRERGAAACGTWIHTAVGGLVSAPLILVMGTATTTTTGHHHGLGAAGLLIPALGYITWSVLLALRRGSRLRLRLLHATMGLSTAMMAAAMLV